VQEFLNGLGETCRMVDGIDVAAVQNLQASIPPSRRPSAPYAPASSRDCLFLESAARDKISPRIAARAVPRMFGVAMPRLIQGDHAPCGRQRSRERFIRDAFDPVRMERDDNPALGIEIRQPRRVALKSVSLHRAGC
jgi:hypothetical protein